MLKVEVLDNETDVLTVGEMNIENRLDRKSVLVLKRVIDAAIDEMKRDKKYLIQNNPQCHML